jgi:hypothetical protein
MTAIDRENFPRHASNLNVIVRNRTPDDEQSAHARARSLAHDGLARRFSPLRSSAATAFCGTFTAAGIAVDERRR